MAGRLILTSQVEIQIPGEPPFEFGGKGNVYGLNISGVFDSWRGSVADAGTATLWDATTSSVASFEFFVVKSSQDVMLELKGTGTVDSFDIKLRANTPFYLTMDDCLAYNAAGGFSGAAQVLKKISVKNSSGSAATIQAVAIL